jgi:pyrimidine 5'-nucleotidase
MGCLQSTMGEGAAAGDSSTVRSRSLEATDLDVIFVDCDDTIYFNNWATAVRLKNKISNFTSSRLGLEDSYAFSLYQKYGTALRGLLSEGLIPPERVEEYLHAVHDVPLSEINRDPALRKMLLQLQVRRWIFTASSKEHAMRCMKRVGVDDLFEGVIDCRQVNLVTKHDPESFKIAMKTAGVSDPSRCMLLDDSVQNIRSAKSMGMRTCLVGLVDRESSSRIICPQADCTIDRLIELQDVLPGLFSPKKKFSVIGGKRYSFIASRKLSTEELEDKSQAPEVVFVLGPPGCGKGTQCAKISTTYNAVHLSAGDLLRQEQNNPKSEKGALIAKHMKEGTIVPVEITCNLLLQAIQSSKANRVLVDGFPRSIDNLDGWFRYAHDYVNTLGVLYFEVDDENELARRILERAKTSGREDDNEEVLKKRFATMRTTTLPVIKRLENELVVRKVGALDSIDNVWSDVQMAMDGWWTKKNSML